MHASCAALNGEGVLLLGPPGAAKSDLVLRLMGRGWDLVADDQVDITETGGALMAAPPKPLAGMLEVHGIGIVKSLPYRAPVRLCLVVTLLSPGDRPRRLPEPLFFTSFSVRLQHLAMAGQEASAPEKLALALDLATGRASLAAGAF